MSSVLCLVIGSKNDFYCLMLACLQPLPRGGHGGWNTRGAGVELDITKQVEKVSADAKCLQHSGYFI